MDATTLQPADAFAKQSGTAAIPSPCRQGSTSPAKKSGALGLPSESRLWKLAATETLSVDIESLLLVLVLLLGFILVADGLGQLLWCIHTAP
jgi:hypothetical protein